MPVRLGFEVALAGSTWLMLNAAASHSKFDSPVINLVDPAKDRTQRLTQNTVIGTAGVRQILVGGLVDFSVFGGIQAGNSWVNGDALGPAELSAGVEAGSSALSVGALAGVAAERELVESLALRIGVDVVSARWTRTTSAQMTDDGVKETHLRETRVALELDPSLELRLYF